MTKLHESVETTLDRASAFAYISDWSRQAEWDPNTVSVEPISDGGPAVGARYALKVKGLRSPMSMEYRITELVEPERLVLIGEGSGVWTEDVITFAETDGGTKVDYEAEIRLSGALKLLQPFLGRYFDSLGQGVVEGMTRELDARA